MKNFTLTLLSLVFIASMLQAQTTLQVGATKTYATITDAFAFIKTDAATEYVINVDEGTYIEVGVPSSRAGIKVTLTGAGADKTIIKKSESSTFGLTSTENPGRLFQITNATTDINNELIFQKMTFQTIGFTNTNGGGVVNATQSGAKITFSNCNFKNIFGRAGAIIQATGANAVVNFNNCFIEECGSFDNNSQEGIIKVNAGDLTISNCSFLNNTFDAINRGTTSTGTDRDNANGQLVLLGGAIVSAQFIDCNIVNNQYITGDLTKVHPMISVKPATTGAAPAITLTNASPTIIFSNVISVGNSRASSLDCDLYYNSLVGAPTFQNLFFNNAKTFDANTTPVTIADVTGAAGITISADATASSYFVMDGAAPQIAVNSLGVKSLVRKAVGVSKSSVNDLKAWSANGVLRMVSPNHENVSIYNVVGAKVAEYKNVNQIELKLNKGIYILKTQNSSIKINVN